MGYHDASRIAGGVHRGATDGYPSLSWVRRELRTNLVAPTRLRALSAYVVGSEARGTAGEGSDLDIAVVIPRARGRSSLQVTEAHHSKFRDDRFRPRWGGRVVDFQFFFEGDPELDGYDKIPLEP